MNWIKEEKITVEMHQGIILPKMEDEKRDVFNKILDYFKNNRIGYMRRYNKRNRTKSDIHRSMGTFSFLLV